MEMSEESDITSSHQSYFDPEKFEKMSSGSKVSVDDTGYSPFESVNDQVRINKILKYR